MERYGNTREIFASINAHGGDVSRFGDIMLTPSWIIYNKSLDVVALPVEEVLWVYECTNHEFGAPPLQHLDIHKRRSGKQIYSLAGKGKRVHQRPIQKSKLDLHWTRRAIGKPMEK